MSEQQVPNNYGSIARLVAAFMDDKLNEFRAEIADTIESHRSAILYNGQRLDTQAATIGGLQSAVADLQQAAGESMPEHVYKQFIRAEAERLRIVKRVVRDGDED